MRSRSTYCPCITWVSWSGWSETPGQPSSTSKKDGPQLTSWVCQNGTNFWNSKSWISSITVHYSITFLWKSLLTIMLTGPQCLWMNSQWSTFCLRTKQQPAPAWPKHDSLSIAMISPSLTSKKKAPGLGKSNPRRVLDLMRTITRERRDPVVHNLSAGSTTCDLCHDNTAS